MSRPGAFGALVVGGGVVGLATAWHLARLGCERVALVERFRLGHERASSHGFSRITRTSYGEELYVRLMQHAHAEEWPRLERDAGVRLRHPTPGAFFGPAGGAFEAYATAVEQVGVDVERIEPAEARRRFPLLRFEGAAGVLHDRTAALIDAAGTMRALARRCSVEGVHVLEETRVRSFDAASAPITVETDRGTLRTERLVLAPGPWLGALVPSLAAEVTVKRQSIGFFRVDAPREALAPGRFPVWIWLGEGANGTRYGLPEFGREGLKAGLHVVAGDGDDPDSAAVPDEAVLGQVREFLASQLAVRIETRLHAETCHYTCTPDEGFRIGPLPGAPGVTLGAACSGHGFKFGPLTGRLLAELAMNGRTSVPAFEEHRVRFAP